MTAFYVILIVLAVLLFLLFCSVRVKLFYDGTLFLRIYFLCFYYTISPKPEKKQKKQDKDTEKKPKEKSNLLQDTVKSKGISGTISLFADFAGQVMATFKKLLSHILVSPFVFKLSVVGSDAAQTAIEYGAVCAAVYPLLSALYGLMRFKKPEINIFADYVSKEWDFKIKFIARIRLIFLLTGGIAFIKETFKFIKVLKEQQKEGMVKHE